MRLRWLDAVVGLSSQVLLPTETISAGMAHRTSPAERRSDRAWTNTLVGGDTGSCQRRLTRGEDAAFEWRLSLLCLWDIHLGCGRDIPPWRPNVWWCFCAGFYASRRPSCAARVGPIPESSDRTHGAQTEFASGGVEPSHPPSPMWAPEMR